MNKDRIYQFKPKSFKKAYKLADDIYCLCVILDDYCSFHADDNEVRNLIPFTDFIRKQADELNGFFLDIDMNIIEDEVEGDLL